MLTGHSKGGAEAQLSAVGLELPAVVFNSDWVGKNIFNIVLQSNAGTISADKAIDCFPTGDSSLSHYFQSGAIKDVRMVNDPLVKWLHDTFGCSLPHANIEWLVDTSSCSSDDGHSIEAVVRELSACAASQKPSAIKSP